MLYTISVKTLKQQNWQCSDASYALCTCFKSNCINLPRSIFWWYTGILNRNRLWRDVSEKYKSNMPQKSCSFYQVYTIISTVWVVLTGYIQFLIYSLFIIAYKRSNKLILYSFWGRSIRSDKLENCLHKVVSRSYEWKFVRMN